VVNINKPDPMEKKLKQLLKKAPDLLVMNLNGLSYKIGPHVHLHAEEDPKLFIENVNYPKFLMQLLVLENPF